MRQILVNLDAEIVLRWKHLDDANRNSMNLGQSGRRNKSVISIEDESDANFVAAQQLGRRNEIKMTGGNGGIDDDSNRNTVLISQLGMDNETEVEIEDYADDNLVISVQRGSDNLIREIEIEDDSNMNIASAEQNGSENEAIIQIDDDSDMNIVASLQNGSNNDSDIDVDERF